MGATCLSARSSGKRRLRSRFTVGPSAAWAAMEHGGASSPARHQAKLVALVAATIRANAGCRVGVD